MRKPATWFNLSLAANGTDATLDIFDEIGFWGVTAKDFVTQLRSMGNISRLTVNLDCPGGDCNEGFTIYDAIKASNAEVTVNITGLAASMASVIMLAAKTIRIAENGRVMVHRVTSGAAGNADELDAAARTTRQFEDRIVALYMERTKQDEATVRGWMSSQNGTWFFGAEAVTHGFADEVMTGTKAAAFQQRWAGMFTMLPAALFDTSGKPSASTAPTKTMTEEELKAAQEKLAADQKALEDLTKEAEAKAKKLVDDAAAEAAKLKEQAATNLATIEARLKKIEDLAANGILSASSGGAPVSGAASGQTGAGEMTKAEFDKLDHAARNAFFKNGGKLIG